METTLTRNLLQPTFSAAFRPLPYSMKSKLLLTVAFLSTAAFAFADEAKSSDKAAAEKKAASKESCGECCEAPAKADAKRDSAQPAPASESKK
jgi:hypothetical protein